MSNFKLGSHHKRDKGDAPAQPQEHHPSARGLWDWELALHGHGPTRGRPAVRAHQGQVKIHPSRHPQDHEGPCRRPGPHAREGHYAPRFKAREPALQEPGRVRHLNRRLWPGHPLWREGVPVLALRNSGLCGSRGRESKRHEGPLRPRVRRIQRWADLPHSVGRRWEMDYWMDWGWVEIMNSRINFKAVWSRAVLQNLQWFCFYM